VRDVCIKTVYITISLHEPENSVYEVKNVKVKDLPKFFRTGVVAQLDGNDKVIVSLSFAPCEGKHVLTCIPATEPIPVLATIKATMPMDFRVNLTKVGRRIVSVLEISVVPSFFGKLVGGQFIIYKWLKQFYSNVRIYPAAALTARTASVLHRTDAVEFIRGEEAVILTEPACMGVSAMRKENNVAVYDSVPVDVVRDALNKAMWVRTEPRRITVFVPHWLTDQDKYFELLREARELWKEEIEKTPAATPTTSAQWG